MMFNQTSNTAEEERRLFYVAMTRAKQACYFYEPSGLYWDEILKDDFGIGNIKIHERKKN